MSGSIKAIGVLALVAAGAAAAMFVGAFASEGGPAASEPIATGAAASLEIEDSSAALPSVEVGGPFDRLGRLRELEALPEIPCAPGSDGGVGIFAIPDPCARAGGSPGSGWASGSGLTDPGDLMDIICGSRGSEPGYGVPGIVANGPHAGSHDSRVWSDDHTTYYRYTERDSEGRISVVLGWELNEDGSGRTGAIEYNEDGNVVSVSYTEWDSEGRTTFDYQYEDPAGADADEALAPIEERESGDDDDGGESSSGPPGRDGASLPDPVDPDAEATLDEFCQQLAQARAERECRTDPDCDSPVDTNCDDPFVNPDPSKSATETEGDSTTVVNCGEEPGDGGCAVDVHDVGGCVDTTPDQPCPTQDPGPDGPAGPGGTDPRCPGTLGAGGPADAGVELDTPDVFDEMCAMIDCGQSWTETYFSETLLFGELNVALEGDK